ncbi:MAG TPA: hypothetical protein VLK84_15305 [Longimicrobium sp.]|nr:hypothetical protein [Longimicrobium sp.]
MKLDPDDLVISSFETSDEALAVADSVASLPPACPLYPTPHTRCFECPEPTLGICPLTGAA